MRQTIPEVTKPTTNGRAEESTTRSLMPGDGALGVSFGDTETLSGYGLRPVAKKRRWPIMLAALLAIVAAVALYMLLQSPKGPATIAVTRGTILSTVETTGQLQAANSAKLAFKTSGRVVKVSFKQGDPIKAGDVLAELETDVQKRQLDQATIELQISKLKLQEAKQGGTEEQVASAQANLDAAVAKLNSTKSGPTKEDLDAAQATLSQAQARLDSVKKGASTHDIAIAQAQLDQAQANRDLVATTAANNTEQARLTMSQAAQANQNWLDPQGLYEQARLNYEAAVKSEKSQVAAADAQVTQAQEALNKLKAGATAEELREAQEGVTLAAANLEKIKKGATEDEIKAAQAAVGAAQANLTTVKDGAGSMEIAILDEQVRLAQLSVDDANAQIADARLVSPINGTVLSFDLDAGETVGGYQPVAVVADTGSLRIKGDVDELDVGRVSAGQTVTVTLDAYPGIKMHGTIESLAPGATQKQGSTVYQATINFTPTEGVVPREGMAANVDITAQRKENVLLLPNRAFETVGNRQYVTVSENGATRKVEVETGLSNNTDTEVLSGVTEGQLVVVK